MTQSRKGDITQVPGARRGRAKAAGEDALAQGASALERAGFADASLLVRWPEIVGVEVARVAQPVRLQEGPEGATLTLRCAPGSAVLMQHETRALIERVNAYLGHARIARLRIVTGSARAISSPPKHPAAGRAAESDSPSPLTLAEALARLGRRRVHMPPKRGD